MREYSTVRMRSSQDLLEKTKPLLLLFDSSLCLIAEAIFVSTVWTQAEYDPNYHTLLDFSDGCHC